MERYTKIRNYIISDIESDIDLRVDDNMEIEDFYDVANKFNGMVIKKFKELYDLIKLGEQQRDFVKSYKTPDLEVDKDTLVKSYIVISDKKRVYYYKFDLTIFSTIQKLATELYPKLKEDKKLLLNSLKKYKDKEKNEREEYFYKSSFNLLLDVDKYIEKIDNLSNYNLREIFEEKQSLEEIKELHSKGKLSNSDIILGILYDNLYANRYHNELKKYSNIK